MPTNRESAVTAMSEASIYKLQNLHEEALFKMLEANTLAIMSLEDTYTSQSSGTQDVNVTNASLNVSLG